MSKTLELVQALGSKICHDLAGSIGTIDNCLSLLGSDNIEVGDKAKKLVLKESKRLVSTIKFLRSTYGISDRNAKIGVTEIENILSSFFEGSSVKVTTHTNSDVADVEAYMAKVAFCLVSIAAENINNEGTIDLYINGSNSGLFKIHSNGRNFPLKPESIEVLNGAEDLPLSVKNCREHYASNICKEFGYKISVDKNEGFTQYLVVKNK